MAIALAALAVTTLALAAPSRARADSYSGPPTPCDKDLSVGDMAGILNGKATITHYSMTGEGAEGCEMGVAADGIAMVDISIAAIDEGGFQMQVALLPAHKTVPGVGDAAVLAATRPSNIPDATETDLYARKGGLVCRAQLHRTTSTSDKLVVPKGDDAIGAKLAGLCTKLFAARGGG